MSDDAATVCIANIGPKEKQKRLRFGIVGILITLGIAGGLAAAGSPLWAKLLVFVPALGTAISLFQVTEQTCVALAARGVMNLDDGDKPIQDAQIKEAISRQVRRVYAKSAAAAAVFTLVLAAI